MQIKTLWIGLVALIMFCGCATQDDVYTLDHRLSALERRNLDLEKRNRDLQKLNQDLLAAKENISSQVEGLDKNRRADELEIRGQYAGLAAQLQRLQETSQMHNGRLEEMEYLLKQKLKGFEDNQLKNRQRMDRMATDTAAVQKRINVMEQYLDTGSSQTRRSKTPPVVVAAPAAPAGGTTDQKVYLKSKKAFDAANYEDARKGFKELISTYPRSPHADNSQFWIGESYYREKWYEKAILEYQKVIEKYPSGNKIPAAILKQGLSFLQIGESNNARLLLKELVAQHPGTNEAKIAKKKLESL